MADGSVRENPFAEQRRLMEQVGPLYLWLKQWYGDRAEVLIVDPRNQFYLIPRLIHDILKSRPPFQEALKALLMHFPLPAILLNGRVIFSGRIPSMEEVGEILEGEAVWGSDVEGPRVKGVATKR